MKVSKQQSLFKYELGKKGAVIDIDMIIAYLLFMGLIIAVVQFTLSLLTPFTNDFRMLSREKNIITASELISVNFDSDYLSSLCDELDYPGVRVRRVEYNLLGFFMPKKDSSYVTPNAGSNPRVVFARDGEKLRVLIGSGGSEASNVSFILYMKGGAGVVNKTMESEDSFTTSYDSRGYFTVKINSFVSNGDIDEIWIHPISERTFIIPEFYDFPLSEVYVGDLMFSNSCGRQAIRGSQSSFNRYGTIRHDNEIFPIVINGDIWWIN